MSKRAQPTLSARPLEPPAKRRRTGPRLPRYPDPAPLPADGLLTSEHVRGLERDGFCVVRDVVSPANCEALKGEWLQMLEDLGVGFRKDDVATWTPAKHRPVSTRGMQDYPPVAQEPFVWKARLKCKPVFDALWQETDLITSMDRVCFIPPAQLAIAKSWWHLDQARETRRGSLQCVQGMLVLEDIGAGEVSLEVMAGAHRHHARFFTDHVTQDADGGADRLRKCKTHDWFKFADRDRAWYLEQENVRVQRVHAPKGALILWDSRVPHQAIPPANRAERSEKARFTIYVSMVPRAWADPKRLAARRKWFEEGRATSHWPQDGRPFGAKPRTYGQPLPVFPGFSLARQLRARDDPSVIPQQRLMRRLVGYPDDIPDDGAV